MRQGRWTTQKRPLLTVQSTRRAKFVPADARLLAGAWAEPIRMIRAVSAQAGAPAHALSPVALPFNLKKVGYLARFGR